MIVKCGMKHQGLKVFKAYIDDDHRLTLNCFMERSNFVPLCVYIKETVKSRFLGNS